MCRAGHGMARMGQAVPPIRATLGTAQAAVPCHRRAVLGTCPACAGPGVPDGLPGSFASPTNNYFYSR